MALADELKKVPLFEDLNKRQLRKLAKQFRERSYGEGRTVVREGRMSGVGFFTVSDGEAEVTVDGKPVGTLRRGDHFGELALISERERTATVTAVTPLRCLQIPLWDFREFLHENPDVMWKLLQRVVVMLTQNDHR
jgi:CRP-like cAMP-binding protein